VLPRQPGAPAAPAGRQQAGGRVQEKAEERRRTGDVSEARTHQQVSSKLVRAGEEYQGAVQGRRRSAEQQADVLSTCQHDP
jgi:hypothetical protein